MFEFYIDGGYVLNIKKLFDENLDICKLFIMLEGYIYVLLFIDSVVVWYCSFMWYNGSMLEVFGVKELLKMIEELYMLLKWVKIEDLNGNGKVDEILLILVKLDDLCMYFLGFWGIYDFVVYVDK